MSSKEEVRDPTSYIKNHDDSNEIDGDDKVADDGEEGGSSWWERRSKYGPGIEGGGGGGKSRFGGEGSDSDEEDEEEKKHVIFDFRLGEESWPDKTELVGGKSTHWETQKDQSKALVLEPKQRLKLPLDELKEAAGFFGNLDSYTITVDMKIPERLENQVISLYQTRLKRKGSTNEGEALINESGGIGQFGNYGDTSKVKIEVGRRQRVVITVDCKGTFLLKEIHNTTNNMYTHNTGDGTMTTYVDAKKCAEITRSGMFIPGERFSLDCEKGLYLFSSGKEDLMPGGVAITLVRVDSYCMTEAEVKQQRMRDRVFNIWGTFIPLYDAHTRIHTHTHTHTHRHRKKERGQENASLTVLETSVCAPTSDVDVSVIFGFTGRCVRSRQCT